MINFINLPNSFYQLFTFDLGANCIDEKSFFLNNILYNI